MHNTAVHQLLVSRAEQGCAEGHNYNQEAKPPSTAEHLQTFTPLLFTRRSRLEPNESNGLTSAGCCDKASLEDRKGLQALTALIGSVNEAARDPSDGHHRRHPACTNKNGEI